MADLFIPTGLSYNSAPNFTRGVGAMYYDVETNRISSTSTAEDVSEILLEWERDGKNLGATTGDITVTFGNTLEPIEVNDLMAPVVGLYNITETHASIAGELMEVNLKNLQAISPTSRISNTDGALEFSVLPPTAEAHKTVVWAGINKGGKYVVIVLENAINVEETELALQDSEAGSMSVTFTGAARELEDMNRLPIRMFFPE